MLFVALLLALTVVVKDIDSAIVYDDDPVSPCPLPKLLNETLTPTSSQTFWSLTTQNDDNLNCTLGYFMMDCENFGMYGWIGGGDTVFKCELNDREPETSYSCFAQTTNEQGVSGKVSYNFTTPAQT